MNVELVTFDCAQTLVEVTWTLDGFARDCMGRLGLELPSGAYARLLELFAASLPEYLEVNRERNANAAEHFWARLTGRWFEEFGIAPSWILPSRRVSHELMFGSGQSYFRLYSDVAECLEALHGHEIRLAVVSNWDFTLHPILKSLEIYNKFEAVIASLEEGMEKPDPRLFRICLNRLGVEPDKTLHVGDDFVDDIQGASGAGIRSVLLKRHHRTTEIALGAECSISSLSELVGVLKSIG